MPVVISSAARVTPYFIRTGEGVFEHGLLKGFTDNLCVLQLSIFQQRVVYRQTASRRLTEDHDGLANDCRANQ